MMLNRFAAKYSPERAAAFLAALAEACNVGRACATVGISRVTAYAWRKTKPEFAAEWDDAVKIGVSALEDEAHRRAFDGVDEPVYQKGAQVGTVRKYSDTLACFLLSAHDPDRYRKNSSVELNANVSLRDVSDAELRAELTALTATMGATDEILGDESAGCDLV